MPTERPERGDERERKEENKEGGAWELHSLCCSAKEMHYLVTPVLVLYIKEHGRLKTAAFKGEVG